MTAGLTVRFLRDVRHGGASDQLHQTAQALASFVDAAQHSVDVAIYDFRLSDEPAATAVVGALTRAADRGVAVRIGYDAGKPAAATAADFARLGADPAPPGTGEWVTEHFAGTGVQVRAIKAAPQLMHSKYVVRDARAGGERAAVWTGSTNFTDDAWTRQENNVLTVADPATATAYRTDFDELWTAGAIAHTGTRLAGSTTLAGGTTVGWDFCPGDGPAIDAALADRIAGARSRLVLGVMVLTSHRVLAALAAAVDRGVPVSGVYDGGQMDPIVRTWRTNPSDATVLADWKTVSEHLAVKHSTPYSPTGTHDFMHLKVLVADDSVVTGSYNFSANAERNAENQVHLDDPATVTAYAEYLADVAHAYGS